MPGGERVETYEDFVKVHGLLLAASGLPRSLHFQLFQKLSSETFDGGAHFRIETCEDGRQRRLVLTSDSMPKHSHVFLIDHAWTFRLSDAYKQVLLFFSTYSHHCHSPLSYFIYNFALFLTVAGSSGIG
jgi:tubulin--tyrosine ligase-like protein 12